MGLLETIDKLITERGSAAVMDKHLAFVREQAATLEKQIATLQQENTTLKQQLAKCQGELSANATAEDFIEHRGVLFKRKAGGGYHLAVYCPLCQKPAGSPEGIPYHCRCGWCGDFGAGELKQVMEDLPCG